MEFIKVIKILSIIVLFTGILFSTSFANNTLPYLDPVNKWGHTAITNYLSQSSNGKYIYYASARSWVDDFFDQAILFEMKEENNLDDYVLHNIYLEGYEVISSAAQFSEDNSILYVMAQSKAEQKSYVLFYDLNKYQFVKEIPLNTDVRNSHLRYQVYKNTIYFQQCYGTVYASKLFAYDLTTGMKKWEKDYSPTGGGLGGFRVYDNYIYVLRYHFDENDIGSVVISKENLDSSTEEIIELFKLPENEFMSIEPTSDIFVTDKHFILSNVLMHVVVLDRETKEELYFEPTTFATMSHYNESNNLLAYFYDSQLQIVDINDLTTTQKSKQIELAPQIENYDPEQMCFAVPISKERGLAISLYFMYDIDIKNDNISMISAPIGAFFENWVYIPSHDKYLCYKLSGSNSSTFYLLDYKNNNLAYNDVLRSEDIRPLYSIYGFSDDKEYLAYKEKANDTTICLMETSTFTKIDSIIVPNKIADVHFEVGSHSIYVVDSLSDTYCYNWLTEKKIEKYPIGIYEMPNGDTYYSKISNKLFKNQNYRSFVGYYTDISLDYFIVDNDSNMVDFTRLNILEEQNSIYSSLVYNSVDTTFYYLTSTGVWSKKVTIGSNSELLQSFGETEEADISLSEDGKFITVLNVSTKQLFIISTDSTKNVKEVKSTLIDELLFGADIGAGYLKVWMTPDNKYLQMSFHNVDYKKTISGIYKYDISDITSVEESEKGEQYIADGMTVFPNPIQNNTFSVEINSKTIEPGIYTLELYSITGEKVQTWDNINSELVNNLKISESLAPGIYTLVINDGNLSISAKVVINK